MDTAAIPLTCGLCTLIATPRTPCIGDHAQRLRSACSRSPQPWLTLLTRVAPFERALIRLALAQLHVAERQRDDALALLAAVRALCTPHESPPTLIGAEICETCLTPSLVPASRHPDGLTTREVDVLRLLAGGRTIKQIAATLFLSPRTVERHITTIYRKIGARGRVDATAYALTHDLLPTNPATVRSNYWEDDGKTDAIANSEGHCTDHRGMPRDCLPRGARTDVTPW